MFLIDLPSVDEAPRWPVPFSERLAALQAGERHVAYIYPRPDNSTFRYRVLNMLEALAGVAGVGASWFEECELANLDVIVDSADVLVLVRCKYSAAFASLVARGRAMGKRIFFDIDDLVFDTKYILSVLQHLGHLATEDKLDYWFADYGRYGALLQLCDGAIVTNEYLAARLREFCDLPTYVVPNFMNRAQLAYSERIRDQKAAAAYSRDGRVHLGYFSGSPTHQRDFSVAEPALLRLLEANDDLVLRVVGQLELGQRFLRFADRIERFPMQSILALQRLIAEVEINLVPLRNNPFTSCKSELKYFEAAAVATVTVASPIFTLAHAITHGVNGYLALGQAWLPVLNHAIDGIRGSGEYWAIAQTAANHALTRYLPEAQAQVVRMALFGGSPDWTTAAESADA